MVDLVLDDARLEAGRLDDQLLAVLVVGADAHVDRALDVDEDARQAQAALLAVSSSRLDHSMSGLTSATIGLSGSTR